MKSLMIIYYLKYKNRISLEILPILPWTINIICLGKSSVTQIPHVTNQISAWWHLDLTKMA